MSELRKDPIIGRWVIIASDRGKRPNDFVTIPRETHCAMGCPFCRGNESFTPPEIYAVRPDGSPPNQPGWLVRVVPNKFPALRVEGNLERRGEGMFDMMNGIGAHEVIIEGSDHNQTMSHIDVDLMALIFDTYKLRMVDLSKDARFFYIMVFKNEGEQAGASLAHPHSQVIATPIIPKRVLEELNGSRNYYHFKVRCIFCDVIHEEQRFGNRIVYENEFFIAFCPFASSFPFEIWLMPKQHRSDYTTIDDGQKASLADAFRITMGKLSRALNEPQYNYILHTRPCRTPQYEKWETISEDFHWHFEIMPKLTRIAGFEWGTGFYINPTPPEDAAAYLREMEV